MHSYTMRSSNIRGFNKTEAVLYRDQKCGGICVNHHSWWTYRRCCVHLRKELGLHDLYSTHRRTLRKTFISSGMDRNDTLLSMFLYRGWEVLAGGFRSFGWTSQVLRTHFCPEVGEAPFCAEALVQRPVCIWVVGVTGVSGVAVGMGGLSNAVSCDTDDCPCDL